MFRIMINLQVSSQVDVPDKNVFCNSPRVMQNKVNVTLVIEGAYMRPEMKSIRNEIYYV